MKGNGPINEEDLGEINSLCVSGIRNLNEIFKAQGYFNNLSKDIFLRGFSFVENKKIAESPRVRFILPGIELGLIIIIMILINLQFCLTILIYQIIN